MIEQEYTADGLKKAMLNEACPKMEAYYSDIYEDFKVIDQMEIGQTAQWFYRLHGTSLKVENLEAFRNDLAYWKNQVFKAYTILKTGRDKFSVKENII